MMFALSLKPLVQLIRQENVCSISVNSCKQHLSLCADDILLFISDLQVSFHQTLKEFEKFSINWDGSSLLLLNCMAKKVNISIQTSISYLGGIVVHSSLHGIYKF